jgi:Tfp pilus assembly protein PilW
MIPMIRNQRGLTLVELTVVFVLATLVMAGLVGFYLNSQSTWLDGSAHAQSQREATLLIEMMADSIHAADRAVVTDYPNGDALHQQVTLYLNNTPWYAFWWSPMDSMVHGGLGPGILDNGALTTFPVSRFQMQSVGDTLIVLTMLEARTTTGDLIHIATGFATYNR